MATVSYNLDLEGMLNSITDPAKRKVAEKWLDDLIEIFDFPVAPSERIKEPEVSISKPQPKIASSK